MNPRIICKNNVCYEVDSRENHIKVGRWENGKWTPTVGHEAEQWEKDCKKACKR